MGRRNGEEGKPMNVDNGLATLFTLILEGSVFVRAKIRKVFSVCQ